LNGGGGGINLQTALRVPVGPTIPHDPHDGYSRHSQDQSGDHLTIWPLQDSPWSEAPCLNNHHGFWFSSPKIRTIWGSLVGGGGVPPILPLSVGFKGSAPTRIERWLVAHAAIGAWAVVGELAACRCWVCRQEVPAVSGSTGPPTD